MVAAGATRDAIGNHRNTSCNVSSAPSPCRKYCIALHVSFNTVSSNATRASGVELHPLPPSTANHKPQFYDSSHVPGLEILLMLLGCVLAFWAKTINSSQGQKLADLENRIRLSVFNDDERREALNDYVTE